ncbi:MAG: hypothetical protein M3Z75_20675 [Actinomycetota bacterium]|nr:hypothetical protein [Actinomycetota bacterium]
MTKSNGAICASVRRVPSRKPASAVAYSRTALTATTHMSFKFPVSHSMDACYPPREIRT